MSKPAPAATTIPAPNIAGIDGPKALNGTPVRSSTSAAGPCLGDDQRVARFVSADTSADADGTAVARVSADADNPAVAEVSADADDPAVDVPMDFHMIRNAASSSGVCARGAG